MERRKIGKVGTDSNFRRCLWLCRDKSNAVKSPAPRILASACKALPLKRDKAQLTWTVEGIGNTPAIVLIATAKPPKSITLDGTAITDFTHADGLLHIRFPNEVRPRELSVEF